MNILVKCLHLYQDQWFTTKLGLNHMSILSYKVLKCVWLQKNKENITII